VRQTIRKIDATLALFDVRTMEAQLSQALFLSRATALLFGIAGFMGLLVATVGLYGLISFAVVRRTKEIGIRMALGAGPLQVLGMVMKRGLFLTAIGSVIGLGVALALSRITASLLYGVSSTDTATFLGVPVFLVLVASVACLVPANRASRIDPIRALRHE
jgi:ABC-type antimicrobial peptide transport system permease subunit